MLYRWFPSLPQVSNFAPLHEPATRHLRNDENLVRVRILCLIAGFIARYVDHSAFRISAVDKTGLARHLACSRKISGRRCRRRLRGRGRVGSRGRHRRARRCRWTGLRDGALRSGRGTLHRRRRERSSRPSYVGGGAHGCLRRRGGSRLPVLRLYPIAYITRRSIDDPESRHRRSLCCPAPGQDECGYNQEPCDGEHRAPLTNFGVARQRNSRARSARSHSNYLIGDG